MNLGEKIYNLRMSKNLSQGDLAEMLGVSRQSISKWENNSAVPDLEKIIKLSDIFDVSIDEIVKGANTFDEKQSVTQQDTATVEYVQVVHKSAMEGRKIAGIILFCMAFFLTFGILFAVGSFGGIFYAIPFIVCGIICFTVKNNTGLWCAWALYLILDIFIRWGTGISRSMVLLSLQWKPEMNYMRLAFAWVLVLITVVMFVVTVKRFKNRPLVVNRTATLRLVSGWTVLLAARLARRFIVSSGAYRNWIIENLQDYSGVYLAADAIVSNVMFIWFIVMVIYSWRYIVNRKK